MYTKLRGVLLLLYNINLHHIDENHNNQFCPLILPCHVLAFVDVLKVLGCSIIKVIASEIKQKAVFIVDEL